MKIRVYCEKCEKEYLLEVGQPWVGLMTCPHDIEYHILKEVINDEEVCQCNTHASRD